MPPSFVRLTEGVRRPSTWRERVELKVGWPTVKFSRMSVGVRVLLSLSFLFVGVLGA